VASFAAADGDALDLAAVSLPVSSSNNSGDDHHSATLVAALVGVRGTVMTLKFYQDTLLCNIHACLYHIVASSTP